MTILSARTGPRPVWGGEWGTIFKDGDGDENKILSPKIGGAEIEKHSPPRLVPDIYNIIKYYK